jgi:hypothetical protein
MLHTNEDGARKNYRAAPRCDCVPENCETTGAWSSCYATTGGAKRRQKTYRRGPSRRPALHRH